MPGPTLTRENDLPELFAPVPDSIPHEHCNVCGPAVPARYSAVRGDTDFYFCAHHIRKTAGKLRDAGFVITPDDIDYDWKKNKSASQSDTAEK